MKKMKIKTFNQLYKTNFKNVNELKDFIKWATRIDKRDNHFNCVNDDCQVCFGLYLKRQIETYNITFYH